MGTIISGDHLAHRPREAFEGRRGFQVELVTLLKFASTQCRHANSKQIINVVFS